MWSTPNGSSASTTALTTADGAAIVFDLDVVESGVGRVPVLRHHHSDRIAVVPSPVCRQHRPWYLGETRDDGARRNRTRRV